MSGPTAIFRRGIIAWAESNWARAAIEDDYHDFEVTVTHDGHTVTDVSATAIRFPWSTCPGAAVRLQQLRGAALSGSGGRPPARIDPALHCTHLHDLARLAIAQATRGGRRQYDIAVPDRADGCTRATIRRDGAAVFEWDVAGDRIAGPEPFAGHDLTGRANWDGRGLNPDALEAAMLLRRAVTIAARRANNPKRPPRALMMRELTGACHSYQPDIIAGAVHSGEILNFTDQPDGPLSRLKLAQAIAR